MQVKKIDNMKIIFVGIGIGVSTLVVAITRLLISNNFGKYYFSNNSYESVDEIIQTKREKNN